MSELQDDDGSDTAQQRELNADLEDVEHDDRDEHGDDGKDPVRALLGVLVEVVVLLERAGAVSGGVALAGSGQTLLIPLDVEHTDNDEHDGHEQAEQAARADIGAEVAGAQDVVGHGHPGDGQTEVEAEGVTGDDGRTVDVRLAAELERDGVADEQADEAGDAGHGEDGGEQAHAEGDVLRADEVEDDAREAVRAAGHVKQFAEQSAEEEQDHPRLHEADKTAHVGVKQTVDDIHLVDDHQNDGADNAANQGGHVFVAEQADEQNGRYENQNVHKYSPIYYCIRSDCQAIKSSARCSAAPTASVSAVCRKSVLYCFSVCLTV